MEPCPTAARGSKRGHGNSLVGGVLRWLREGPAAGLGEWTVKYARRFWGRVPVRALGGKGRADAFGRPILDPRRTALLWPAIKRYLFRER